MARMSADRELFNRHSIAFIRVIRGKFKAGTTNIIGAKEDDPTGQAFHRFRGAGLI
jgi:hypothetical protein